MGFWKPLGCQEAARMAEFSSFRFSAARRFLSWQMTVGNPWGWLPGRPGSFRTLLGKFRFGPKSCFFRISYAHKTADCRLGSDAKTRLGYQKNFLLLHWATLRSHLGLGSIENAEI